MKLIIAFFAMLVMSTATAQTYQVNSEFCRNVSNLASMHAQGVLEDYVLGYAYERGDIEAILGRDIEGYANIIKKTTSPEVRRSLMSIQLSNYWLKVHANEFENYIAEALVTKDIETALGEVGPKMGTLVCKPDTTFEYTPVK